MLMLSPNTYLVTVGSEVEVVPDMLLTGAFAHVDAVMVEWSIHKKIVPRGWEDRNGLLKQLKVKTLALALKNKKKIQFINYREGWKR